jgi:hypothetical protein
LARRPPPPRPSYADKVRGTPPVADAKFHEPSGSKKNPPEFPKITSFTQKSAAPVAGGVASKEKSSEKKKPAAPVAAKKTSFTQKSATPVAGGVASKEKSSEKKKPATPVAAKKTSFTQKSAAPVTALTAAPVAGGGVASKEKSSQKNKREVVDWFSHPSHPPNKKEKKIREKLGLQAEMALSQASLTSAATTFSLLQAAVTRAKEEIEIRDDKIELLENSSGFLTKYVPMA